MEEKSTLGESSKRRELYLTLLFAIVIVVLGATMAYQRGVRGPLLAVTLATFTLLVMGYCLFGTRLVMDWVRSWLAVDRVKICLGIVILLIPYLIYAAGTDTFNRAGALKLLAFLFLPTIVLLTLKPLSPQLTWQYAVAILAIWLPFDFRLLKGIWFGDVTYGFNTLLAVNLALILFVGYCRIEGVGYHFRANRAIIIKGVLNLLFFTPIAIGLGLATGFLTWAPQQHSAGTVVLTALLIFLFIALPEELLFRGLIQNLLTKSLQSEKKALIITSIIFGAAHLNNADYPRNLIYFLLASIAGYFYGRAYLATGALLAGAITHTLVDTIWHELFR
ncbi:MAG: type II CAAX endopeptidase family protein [Acidobacteriota bacterium]